MYNIIIKELIMKRKLTIALTSLLLVAGMIFTLCACSSYGSVKNAYKKEGYGEIELSQEYKKYVTDMFGEENADVITIHVLQKSVSDDASVADKAAAKLTTTVIAEFKSTDEMNEQMKKHVTQEDAEAIAEAIQKLDNVSGNCVLVFTLSTDSANIFKSTK